MCSIHIQESKWLVFAFLSCAYAYTELKKGLSLSKLESLKGEWKEDGLPLMKPLSRHCHCLDMLKSHAVI